MAISRASYSAGNKVYRGTSSAPTTGPVDKMGYIEREMNKPMVNYAAAAKVKLNSPGFSANDVNKTPAMPKQATGIKTTPTGTIVPAPVSINNPGTQAPQTTGTALPLGSDQYLPQQDADLTAGHNSALQQYQAQQDAENLNYGTSLRNDQLAEPQAERSLLDNAAARGLAQSSGYGYSVGQQQDAYQRQLSDLAATHNNTLNSIATGINTENQNYNNQLSGYQTAAGNRLAAQAGTLGLDGSNTPVKTIAQYLSALTPATNTAVVKPTSVPKASNSLFGLGNVISKAVATASTNKNTPVTKKVAAPAPKKKGK